MISYKYRSRTIKKSILSLFLFTICFLLTGCASRTITQIAPQAPDPQADSYQIGNKLNVANPGDPFVVLDIKDALAYDGMYYASWTIGDSIPYTNADNKEVALFDAQLYLVSSELPSAEEAVKTTKNWYASAKENYQITEEYSFTANLIEYQIISYTYKGENPYKQGISAFTSSDNAALCVELTARDTLNKDLSGLLEQFLSGCSFAE